MTKYNTHKRFLKPFLLAASISIASTATAATLNVASPQDPGSWDPIDTYLLAWSSVATNIFDGLTYRDTDLQLKPGLATNWEVLDAGKRVRFVLREGVTFHNGEPFNAEAVKYTFERLLGEEGKKDLNVLITLRSSTSKLLILTQ
ncbi:ABC transporter substrate-binding protein [Psychromonas sp. KJ10-10]|uniref:ABC transporter substrate-binding protein n=1 Tax=Psychromonas sp. KJ10-10 TaxID=3391823 RepID=UPI0039B678C5